MQPYNETYMHDRFDPHLPVYIRLDGCNFSRWTIGLQKPFDPCLHEIMVHTTKDLVKEMGAICGYTASDEITLVLYAPKEISEIYSGGRIQKLISRSASKITKIFNLYKTQYLPNKPDAEYDSRAQSVQTLSDIVDMLRWREQNTIRNSINMLARCHYSHKECMNKNSDDLLKMLEDKDIHYYTDYPIAYCRGTWCIHKKAYMTYTPTEIEHLPEKHAARLNPDLKIERSYVHTTTLPPLIEIKNLEEVIQGHDPII